MERYLIALDLDGTLLTKDKRITDLSKEYINKLIDRGHIVCLATGRPYAGMSNYYEELGLKTPLICSNGGMICNPNDDNFKKVSFGIDRNITNDICFKMENCIVDAYFSSDEHIYLTSHNDKLSVFIHIDENSIIHEGKMYEITDINPSGMILIIKEDKVDEFENYVYTNYGDTISLRQFYHDQGDYIYELYQTSISKASALKLVLEYYGLTNKSLIAIGDGDNDLEMLEYAYVGVSMINGREEVLSCAKYITKYDNDNEGVITFLDHFIGYNELD